jgi:hypothetical protein
LFAVCTSKNQWKNNIFSSKLFKNENFFKILKTNDYLNYLEKLVDQHFLKTLFDASESAKNTFFVSHFIEREPEKSI